MKKRIMVAMCCLAMAVSMGCSRTMKAPEIIDAKMVNPRVFIDKTPRDFFLGVGDAKPLPPGRLFDFTKMTANIDGDFVEATGIVSPDGTRIITKVTGFVKIRNGKISYKKKSGRIIDSDGKEGLIPEELEGEGPNASPILRKVVDTGRKVKVELRDHQEGVRAEGW